MFKNLSARQKAALSKHYGSDRMELYSASLLSNFSLGSAILLALLFIASTFAPLTYLDVHSQQLFMSLELILVGIYLTTYALILNGKYSFASNMFSATCVAGILSSVLLTGGFPKSIASPCLILLPLIIYCLQGSKAGLKMAIAAPVIAMAQAPVTSAFGITIPDFTSASNPEFNTFLVLLVTYCVAVFVVANYEFQNRQLRKYLAVERETLNNFANEDGLTGLANNRFFDSALTSAYNAARNQSAELAVFYMDVDAFKPINDSHGHMVGDCVLKHIGERIKNCVDDNVVVARVGGDEFAILVTDTKHVDDLDKLKSRLKLEISRPISIAGEPRSIEISIGYARFNENITNKTALMHEADLAMYRDKHMRRPNDRLSQKTDKPSFTEAA